MHTKEAIDLGTTGLTSTDSGALGLDVPGLIRRARREADLSQRELAALLGVNQSTVARWEHGEGVPTIVQFAAALGLAGITLVALDALGQDAEPMSDRAPLDRQFRRYPAHLDLREEPDPLFGWPRLTTPHRRRRDAHRTRDGVGTPRDHPTLDMFAEERRRLRDERVARSLERARARARVRVQATVPGCSCPIECEEHHGCPPGCPCGCERLGSEGDT